MSSMTLGICGWSLDRHDIVRGIRIAADELGLGTVQIGLFTVDSVRGIDASAVKRTADACGMSFAGTFLGFEGEDYSSIERITDTGGYLPDHSYAVRLETTRRAADLTASLGCRSLAVHAGTVPDDGAAPGYARLVERVREVADVTASAGLKLLLETGREPVSVLTQFLEDVARDNVAVNFDPGNLVLYGVDEPAQAMAALKGRIGGVHVKDAVRSAKPGVEFGQAVPLGAGDAQIPRVVSKLRAYGYGGPLLIETSGRTADWDALRSAIEYLRSMIE